jgi:hypothetical protein
MQQGFLIYAGLAFGTSTAVLLARIYAVLRSSRSSRTPEPTTEREPVKPPRPGRRRIAAHWPAAAGRVLRHP